MNLNNHLDTKVQRCLFFITYRNTGFCLEKLERLGLRQIGLSPLRRGEVVLGCPGAGALVKKMRPEEVYKAVTILVGSHSQ